MVFSASYKRIYRSLKQEFRMMCRINAATVSPQQYMQFHDEQCDPQMDYHLADMDIAPVADPRSVTKMQETAKAQVVMQMADAGLVDRQEGARRILEATSIPDVEALLPKPDPMQQQIAQMQMQAGMADIALKLADVQSKIADIEATKAKAVKDLTDAAATAAQIQLDAQLIYLNAVKDGLGQALQRGLGGMAPAPGLRLLRACLAAVHRRQRDLLTQAYWAGNPAPDSQRLALLREQALLEDLFESSAEDIKATMQVIDGK